jgi:hypothetical protein
VKIAARLSVLATGGSGFSAAQAFSIVAYDAATVAYNS